MKEKFINEALCTEHIPPTARGLGKVSEDPDTWAIGCDTCSFTYENEKDYEADLTLLLKLRK